MLRRKWWQGSWAHGHRWGFPAKLRTRQINAIAFACLQLCYIILLRYSNFLFFFLISFQGEREPWAPCQVLMTQSTWNIRVEAAKLSWQTRASIHCSSASESRCSHSNPEALLGCSEAIGSWWAIRCILGLRTDDQQQVQIVQLFC